MKARLTAAIIVALSLMGTAGWAQDVSARPKRPLPPLQHREAKVLQAGVNENPAPAKQSDVAAPDSLPHDHSFADYDAEPESYTPQPLCDPPNMVPTMGLGPTVSVPSIGGPFDH